MIHQNEQNSNNGETTTQDPKQNKSPMQIKAESSNGTINTPAKLITTASTTAPTAPATTTPTASAQTQIVINHNGQLISLPVMQTSNTITNNSTVVSTNDKNSLVTIQQLEKPVNGPKVVKPEESNDDSKLDEGPTIANLQVKSSYAADGSIVTTSGGSTGTTVDGVNLDEIREFAKAFKLRRLALGLTQTQVGQSLSATKGPAYSQSAICRFEKLDITPKSAAKIKPVLEKWMKEAELKYADRLKSGCHHNFADLLGTENVKKRKRRTSFTPQALEVLNEYFEKNAHPSGNQGADITMLANKLNYDREVIRVWFCNKRQALKNSVKKFKNANDSNSFDNSSDQSGSNSPCQQHPSHQLQQSNNQQDPTSQLDNSTISTTDEAKTIIKLDNEKKTPNDLTS